MQRSAQAAVDPQTKPPELGCEAVMLVFKYRLRVFKHLTIA